MTAPKASALLIDEVSKTRAALARLEDQYRSFVEVDLPVLGQTHVSAVVLADSFVNLYTCLETIFFRISQHFENHVEGRRWHADLLHKMSLAVEGVRPAVITDQTHALLSEFLRFRHFKRYYYDFEYDWDRIEFLRKKRDQVLPLVNRDLDAFVAFLRALSA